MFAIFRFANVLSLYRSCSILCIKSRKASQVMSPACQASVSNRVTGRITLLRWVYYIQHLKEFIGRHSAHSHQPQEHVQLA